MNPNYVWIGLLRDALIAGTDVSPRKKKTKELLGARSTIDMKYPVLTLSERKLSYKFMTGEAWWILSGDNTVKGIEAYNSRISEFSEPDGTFFGAYGPRIQEQLGHVVDALGKDPTTRQAVLMTWRPNPPPSRDVPCTLGAQWVIRKGELHCIDYMRSSDLWLGWPYDIFNFSMLSGLICIWLQELFKIRVELGTLTLIAGSQHLYEENWKAAKEVSLTRPFGCPERFQYAPFNPNEFETPGDLIWHLKQLADKDWSSLRFDWLRELSLLSPKT